MKRPVWRCLAVVATLLPLMAAAQLGAPAEFDASSSSLEREKARIQAERSDAQTRFAAEEKACYQKFAVNDCLADVRSHRRTVLADLKRQEVTINDTERKRKAAEQIQRLEERSIKSAEENRAAKQQGAALSQQEREKRAGEKASTRSAAQAAESTNRQSFDARQQSAAQKQADRAAKTAQVPEAQKRFDAKQADAEERRKKREEQRKTPAKPRAQPLPVPAP